MTPNGKLILCVDGAEARLLRRQGYHCITTAKLRRQLGYLLQTTGTTTAEVAAAIARLDGISTAAPDPETWLVWRRFLFIDPALRTAFKALAPIPTPFRDPDGFCELPRGHLWPCHGTTILVARDTFQLVRVADTYTCCDCYRPRGRMDEPLKPEEGRVCLITADELRLLRLDGLEDPEVVLTYKPGDENVTGHFETPHPAALRALCGERPELRTGAAASLVAARCGEPFFMGLTRGIGYEARSTTAADGAGAFDFCLETDTLPQEVTSTRVVWAGGDDVRYLVRFGGLAIFTGAGRRRKAQLRSLGLVPADTVAGAPVYDLATNGAALRDWAAGGEFRRQSANHNRDRNSRRVRWSKSALPKYTRGTYIIHNSPPCIKVTPKSAARKAAHELRRLLVASSSEGCGVSTVHLASLGIGGTYWLNGRAVEKDGEIYTDRKRCRIRCPQWDPGGTDNPAAMLAWLASCPHVIVAGTESRGRIFAVVRIANGTEDQQAEAALRWHQVVGRQFPQACGACSAVPGTLDLDQTVTIASLAAPNWRAVALETQCFDPYKTVYDYGKPLKLERRGPASSASERIRAYVGALEGLDAVGERNSRLARAMLNIKELFGKQGLQEALPALMAKSSLPTREKTRMAKRILGQKGEEDHGNG